AGMVRLTPLTATFSPNCLPSDRTTTAWPGTGRAVFSNISTSVRTFGAKQIPRPEEYSTRTGEGHFVLEQGRRKFATRGGYAVIVIAHYGVQFQQMHPGSIFVLTGTTADKFYQPVKSIFDMTT